MVLAGEGEGRVRRSWRAGEGACLVVLAGEGEGRVGLFWLANGKGVWWAWLAKEMYLSDGWSSLPK